METFQDEITLLDAQITAIQTAIDAIIAGGQSYSISSGSTSRSVTQTDLQTLISERNNLKSQRDALYGNAGLVLGPGW